MLRDVQKFGELAVAFCLFTSLVSFGELWRQEWYGFCVYVFQCTKHLDGEKPDNRREGRVRVSIGYRCDGLGYHLSLSQLPQL